MEKWNSEKTKQRQITHILHLNSTLCPCMMLLFSPSCRLDRDVQFSPAVRASREIQVNWGESRKCSVMKRWREGLHELKRKKKKRQVNKQRQREESQNISHSAKEIKILRQNKFSQHGELTQTCSKKHKRNLSTLRQLENVSETRAFHMTGLEPSSVWAVFFCSSFLCSLALYHPWGPSLLPMTAT